MPPVRRPLEERFWPKVDCRADDECWPWLAYVAADGYGRLRDHGIAVLAHRVAYALVVGPIPDGLTLDHLCRNRACVNPAHLEPVTMRENILRGESLSAQNARKTHCNHGHPLDGRNSTRGTRRCLTCHRLAERERRARRG